jgi:hypothetical protein
MVQKGLEDERCRHRHCQKSNLGDSCGHGASISFPIVRRNPEITERGVDAQCVNAAKNSRLDV